MPIPCRTCGLPKQRPMNKLWFLTLFFLVSALVSCKDEAETFPNVVTQMAEVCAETGGKLTQMTTDDGVRYRILNDVYTDAKPAIYRMFCNYVVEPEGVTLKGATGVWVLHPDKKPEKTLPLTIVSAWKGGGYANLHLQYMRRSARHTLTLTQDRVENGITYLTVHHPWVNDIMAWTVDEYASIPLDEMPTAHIIINETYEFER